MLTKHTLCYKDFLEIKNISKKLKLRLKNTIINKTLTCIRNLDTNKERQKANKRF